MESGEYTLALADFETAMQTPSNLREALGNIDLGTEIDIAANRKPELFYAIGNAYHAVGDSEKALQFWRQAAEVSTGQKNENGADDSTGQFSGHAALGGVAPGSHVAQAALYYQAQALAKLGQADRAKTIFQQLIAEGRQALDRAPAKPDSGADATSRIDREKVADAYYLVGLGRLGMNDKIEAKTEFSTALETCPDHFAAHMALSELGISKP